MQIKSKNLLYLNNEFGTYYSLSLSFNRETYFITDFLRYVYYQVYKVGITRFVDKLYIPDSYGECGQYFEMVTITVNVNFNLIYIHGDTSDFLETIKDPKLRKFYYDEVSDVELCRNNIMPHATMTKDNFIHILTKWGQLYDQTPPFILLYQNDQDWYELEPFETQEAMEQFVEGHTEKTTE